MDGSRPIAEASADDKLSTKEAFLMSRDAKNSIFLWVGTLVGVGLFWAFVHFDIGANVPDRWLWPILGIVIGANVLKSVWDFFRKRKADVP